MNISVTDPILTKLFGHNFRRPWFLLIKIFLDQILFDPNFLGPTNFFGHKIWKSLDPNFFRSQNFVNPKFCWPIIVWIQTFLDQNFLGLNFFLTQIVLDLRFLDHNFVRTKCFSYRPEIILLNSNINATTTSLHPNLSAPKILPKFTLIRNLSAFILKWAKNFQPKFL